MQPPIHPASRDSGLLAASINWSQFPRGLIIICVAITSPRVGRHVENVDGGDEVANCAFSLPRVTFLWENVTGDLEEGREGVEK